MAHPDLLALLKKYKIDLIPNFSGQWVRQGPLWFQGRVVAGYKVAYFGDYSRSLSERWCEADTTKLSQEQQDTLELAFREATEEARRERMNQWDKTQLDAEAEWNTFSQEGESPYFIRKGLPGNLYGCRIEPHPLGNRTIVPARDADGKLWGYQRIYSQKLDIGTDKNFKKGARKQGCFHLLGEIQPEGEVYICEGIATSASVFEALSLQGRSPAVVCAFDTGNLLPVAEALRSKHPNLKMHFCADNDCHGKSDLNPGVASAQAAAKAVGGSVHVPQFLTDSKSKPTDYNDLHLLSGLEAVAEQIRGQGGPSGAGDKETSTTKTKKNSPDKPKKTPEIYLAMQYLRNREKPLIRQDKVLFEYRTTHWEEMTSVDIDQVKNDLNAEAGNLLKSGEVDSLYRTFFRLLESVPQGTSIYEPNPKFGNFLDGTLQLSRNTENGIYTLSFREHRPGDFIGWVVPVKYNVDRSIRNERFEALVAEALQGEPDAPGMLRALKQMGGAMLIPTFPQLFFVHGVSGSRKSTLVLSLAKLIHEKNYSTVDPAVMENHQIEGMMGKLVNICVDVDDKTPLPRGFIKRFEDNISVQVNRKGKPVVQAKLPAVHIYCANELPPNFESGKAFHRRVTLLEFKRDLTHGVAEEANRKGKFEEMIWDQDQGGILNWCLEGLTDLVNSGGKFFKPESSTRALDDWQKEKDPVAQFLDAIRFGEVEGSSQYKLAPDLTITYRNLWAAYSAWAKEQSFRSGPQSVRALVKRLRHDGFTTYMSDTGRKVRGIGGPGAKEDADH